MKKRVWAGGTPCLPGHRVTYDKCYRLVEKTGNPHAVVMNYLMQVQIIPWFEDVTNAELQQKLGYQYIGSIQVLR